MPDTTPAPDTRPASHQQVLAELTRMGLDIARVLHAQVTDGTKPGAAGEAPTPDLPALAAAFDRVSRTVRRTVLLADHLARPQPDPAHAPPDPAQARADAQARARRLLLRTMENRITREHRPVPDPDALRRELLERIDGPDIGADLLTRPLPDLVQELCQDMGLDRMDFVTPYPRRTSRDIARLLAQAHGTHDPHGPAWTLSGPTRLATPQGTPDTHGITPEHRALHAHIMGQGRKRP